jgi:quercetin dioxygenase-like cupin family protein
MPDFTHVNLMDADDAAAGRGTGMEARMARRLIESEHIGVSYFRVDPDTRAPYGHRHAVQEEAYIVVSGSGRFKLDEEIIDVKQWDVVRVAPAVVRAYEAGPDGLVLIAVGSDRPADGDGELVAGWWDD